MGSVRLIDCAQINVSGWDPEGWLVLAPVFDELPMERWLSWAGSVARLQVAILPQGWLRGVTPGQGPAAVKQRLGLHQVLTLANQLRVRLRCVCLSESELEPGAIAALRPSVEILAVTRGAKGAEVFRGDRRLLVDAAPVSTQDATGAGDAFGGALVAALASDVELERAIRLATAAAGLTTERCGAHALDPFRLVALAESVPLVDAPGA